LFERRYARFHSIRALGLGAFFILALLAVTAAAETALVRHVLDGDSFILADGRQARLIGINAPEFGKDGASDQPLARAARDRLAELIANRTVALQFEEEHHDRYGRLLVHAATIDGIGVQEILLRDGLAWAIAIPPNLKKLAAHRAAEAEARAARRGVWREPAYAPRPAQDLSLADTGFRLIEGKILRIGQGAQTIYFDLAPKVAVAVPRAAWARYFRGRPGEWVGRRIVARGWVARTQDRLRLRVAHPAMLTFIE
jgi:endonuclease YncB( thermonuclease family)